MNAQEKHSLVDNVMNALRAGGYAAECIPPAIEHEDKLVACIAERFFRCNEMSLTDSVAYAEIAANVVRRNMNLISLGN